MSAQPKPEGEKTLLLTMRDGTQKKITIPREWKVTFGPLVPGSKDASVNSGGATALRLWSGSKGSEVQHAVFTNVESFRDMSIRVMEQVTKTQTEHYRKADDENAEAVAVEVAVKEWVNPDEPKAAPEVQRTPERGRLIDIAAAQFKDRRG